MSCVGATCRGSRRGGPPTISGRACSRTWGGARRDGRSMTRIRYPQLTSQAATLYSRCAGSAHRRQTPRPDIGSRTRPHPRLVDRLNRGERRRLTLISAPSRLRQDHARERMDRGVRAAGSLAVARRGRQRSRTFPPLPRGRPGEDLSGHRGGSVVRAPHHPAATDEVRPDGSARRDRRGERRFPPRPRRLPPCRRRARELGLV